MIKLYGFGEAFGIADASPFVLKVATYMRMLDIDYEVLCEFKNIRKAPKGKLPFIEHNGKLIADSVFIIDYLASRFGSTLDDRLSDKQRALSYLLGRSLDEDLYWCLVYSRWIDATSWPTVKQAFFSSMPFALRNLVPIIAQRGVRALLHKQGHGRHSREELLHLTARSAQSLSHLLGEQDYFFGDVPCTFDATAYAFLAQFVLVSLENDFNYRVGRHANLVAYCQRMHQRYFS